MSRVSALWRLFSQNLSSAFDALLANRMRSILTTTGVVIGIATMTGVVSLLQGFSSQVSDTLNSLGTSTIYVQKSESMTLGGPPDRSMRSRRDIELSYAEELGRLPGVSAVVPTSQTNAVLKTLDGSDITVSVIGTSPEWLFIGHRELSEGRFFTSWEVSDHRAVCVLGSEVAARLAGDGSAVGSEIAVQGNTLSVVGLLGSFGEMSGESQDDIVLVPYTIFQRWGNLDRNLSLVVETGDPAAMDSMMTAVESCMRRLRGLGIDDENDFALVTAEQLQEGFSSTTKWLFIGMIGLSGLALLVGSVGIANIMLVSVTQRTREIGLRKALGATRSQILVQFLTEAMILSVTGGLIGILAGAAIGVLASAVTEMPAGLEAWSVAVAVGVSALVGMVAGVVPAARAARLEPVKALGHDL
jgi:putative ABC transport system permease protein